MSSLRASAGKTKMETTCILWITFSDEVVSSTRDNKGKVVSFTFVISGETDHFIRKCTPENTCSFHFSFPCSDAMTVTPIQLYNVLLCLKLLPAVDLLQEPF